MTGEHYHAHFVNWVLGIELKSSYLIGKHVIDSPTPVAVSQTGVAKLTGLQQTLCYNIGLCVIFQVGPIAASLSPVLADDLLQR